MPLALPTDSEPGSLALMGLLSPHVLREIEEVAGRLLRRRNAVRPLLDGTEAYGAMLELVESAEREVLFENFIIRGDAVGGAFAEELVGARPGGSTWGCCTIRSDR